mmetsp:Transcript_12168/g.30256  ORF Transcript_12168/g.30256 Transcript_12168/m.30256 type:complete len:216 (+) Transcript_12168:1229-1876(+)
MDVQNRLEGLAARGELDLRANGPPQIAHARVCGAADRLGSGGEEKAGAGEVLEEGAGEARLDRGDAPVQPRVVQLGRPVFHVPRLRAVVRKGDVDAREAMARLRLGGLEGATRKAVVEGPTQVLSAWRGVLPRAVAVRPSVGVDLALVAGDTLHRPAEPAPRPLARLPVVKADPAIILAAAWRFVPQGGKLGDLDAQAVRERLEEAEVLLDRERV